MTYKEAYEKCNTIDELREEIKHDLIVASMAGSRDRMKVIKRVAEEVANRKFGITEGFK